MRRVVIAFVATVTGLVLLLSFKTASSKPARPAALAGTPGTSGAAQGGDGNGSSGNGNSGGGNSGGGNGAGNGPAATPSAPAGPTPAANSATKTVTGSSVQVSEGFRTFGSVQVQVTLSGGKIAKVVAIDYPHNDPRSYEISQYSIPTLEQEVLAAQGTHIDMISGATYTSEAYAQSVQAALDSAKS